MLKPKIYKCIVKMQCSNKSSRSLNLCLEVTQFTIPEHGVFKLQKDTPLPKTHSYHLQSTLDLPFGLVSSGRLKQNNASRPFVLMKAICYELRGKCPLSFCQNSLALHLLSLFRLMGILHDALKAKSISEKKQSIFLKQCQTQVNVYILFQTSIIKTT